MRTIVLTAVAIFIGFISGFVFFKKSESSHIEKTQLNKEALNFDDQDEQSNLKINIEGDLDEIFDGCDPDLEISSIRKRFVCNKKIKKSRSTWRNMDKAESEVISLLNAKDFKALSEYIGCDAYDLTWYEVHCESDREVIIETHIENLMSYLKKNKIPLNKGKWVRETPDLKKLKNPRWVLRSRYKVPKFKLSEPWSGEAHPTEDKVVFMLEQKNNGFIGIIGVPVTGIAF